MMKGNTFSLAKERYLKPIKVSMNYVTNTRVAEAEL